MLCVGILCLAIFVKVVFSPLVVSNSSDAVYSHCEQMYVFYLDVIVITCNSCNSRSNSSSSSNNNNKKHDAQSHIETSWSQTCFGIQNCFEFQNESIYT